MGALIRSRQASQAVQLEAVVQGQQYLTFSVAGELFAIPISPIKELVEYHAPTAVPMMPPFIRAKEAAASAAKTQQVSNAEMKGNFADGLRWESADKKHALSINRRFQFDYRDFSGNDAIAADTFDVRTARLGVAGKFWDFHTFDVTADFGALAADSHLDVAWLNVA